MADKSDYDVGYRRPPKHSQFQKGCSGNPRGRRKGAKNLTTILTAALNETVTVVENGKRRTINKLEAAMKQLANRSASGDHRAIQQLIPLAQIIEAKAEARKEPPAEMSANDLATLNDIAALLKAQVFLNGIGSSAAEIEPTAGQACSHNEVEGDRHDDAG